MTKSPKTKRIKEVHLTFSKNRQLGFMMIKTVAWTCFEKRVSQQVYNPDYPDMRCMTDKVSANEIISSSQEKRKYKL